MKKKTRCYIYTRVSTAIQVDGYSLDAQKDKLRKYAEFQDMEIVGEYSDEGHSGKNIKGHHEFMRMMDDIEESKDGVDFVLVFKLSRFGRTAKQWKDENPDIKGNMRDGATLNQLLILANLESYNAVLIHQGKNQKERMELLRQLALQQIRTLESISTDKLPRLR